MIQHFQFSTDKWDAVFSGNGLRVRVSVVGWEVQTGEGGFERLKPWVAPHHGGAPLSADVFAERIGATGYLLERVA